MQFKKSFYGLVSLVFLFSSSSFAQSNDSLAETRNPKEFCLRSIANSTLKDEAQIWTKPFTLKKRDFNYLLPALGAIGVVMYFDKPISTGLRNYNAENRDLNTYNKTITQFGQGCNNLGLAAAFVAGGLIFKDHRATETGILSAEALLHSGIVVCVAKTISGRERPLVEEGNGDFDFLSDPNAGSSHHSFPSGHTISAWAMATVIATEYKDVKWVLLHASYGRRSIANRFSEALAVGCTCWIYFRICDWKDGRKKPSALMACNALLFRKR
jgi:hypothetical protein